MNADCAYRVGDERAERDALLALEHAAVDGGLRARVRDRDVLEALDGLRYPHGLVLDGEFGRRRALLRLRGGSPDLINRMWQR